MTDTHTTSSVEKEIAKIKEYGEFCSILLRPPMLIFFG
jgi:hypothetical protein